MFIRKRERKLILTYLFTEGVMTSEKNFTSDFTIFAGDDTSPAITVPNLQVIKLMQSLDSKGYVRTTFNWSHYYWFLTDEGVVYLREFLHLPAEVQPLTERKSGLSVPIINNQPEGGRFGRSRRPEGGDRRDGYRRSEGPK